MWVYDGETWTSEGSDDQGKKKPEVVPPRMDEFMPELQVIEYVPSTPAHPPQMPPLPFP
jgi:hypothetical protein